MSRDDLLTTNAGIMSSVIKEIAAAAPDTILIIVSNPLDAMCHVAFDTSGFDKKELSAWQEYWILRGLDHLLPWS